MSSAVGAGDEYADGEDEPPPKRPRANGLSLGDPYAYYDRVHVPRLKDLIAPGRQRFSHGELKGSTFLGAYNRYSFGMECCATSRPDSDEETDLDVWRATRARLSEVYSGTEIWKRFQHYCRAMSANELHDYD